MFSVLNVKVMVPITLRSMAMEGIPLHSVAIVGAMAGFVNLTAKMSTTSSLLDQSVDTAMKRSAQSVAEVTQSTALTEQNSCKE